MMFDDFRCGALVGAAIAIVAIAIQSLIIFFL